MTGLEAARGLLPASVVWGPVFVCALAAFFLSLLSARLGAALALRPLRRARDLTWAERARLAHPARLAARVNSFLLPGLQIVVAFAVAPPLCGLPAEAFALLLILASYAGAALVAFRVERRIRQGRYTVGQWLRAVSILWLLFYGWVLVLLALFLLMPATFNARAWLLLAAGAAAVLLFQVWGGFYLAWLVGLVKPASARLHGIVARAAGGMGVAVRGVHELAFPAPNAWAFPFLGRLAFTPELLAGLDDEELAAVAAHELAHLGESPLAHLGRLLPVVLAVPLAAARPLVAEFGLLALASVAPFLLGAVLSRRLSRRLERRADRLAKEWQTQEGAYARALGKLGEANLAPLVEPGKGSSHPHLYDRLVAAGAPPDFPRPRPPARSRALLGLGVSYLALLAAWLGLVFARPSLPPRGGDERAILRSLTLGGRTATDLSDLALARRDAGRIDEAAVLYQAAAEIVPDSPYYPASQALALAALGRCGEADGAAREAERRQQRDPRFAEESAVGIAREAVLGCLRREQR
jgi:Zn-dependent protease with chaperone function